MKQRVKELLKDLAPSSIVLVAVLAALIMTGQVNPLRREIVEVGQYIDSPVYKQDGVEYDLSAMGGGGGGGAVDSVNGQTGAVSLDADDISDSGTTNKWTTAGRNTKVDHLTVTQPVDLDTLESDTATNNAKTTNATHTGDISGATSTTAQPALISGKTSATPATGDSFLFGDASDSGNLKKGLLSEFLALISGLTVPQGGTGASTFTDAGVIIGNGTGALQATGAGTSGQVLTSNGAGVDPTWQAAPGGGDPTYGSNAGASDNAVYVDADNQMGLGTTTPTSSIHLYDDTLPPTIAYQFFSESGGDVTAYGGTATSVTSSDEGWVNTSNVSANDSANANAGLLTFPSYTEDLKVTNFSFAIPTGATIDGIEVDVEGHSNSGSRAEDVYLVRGGTKDTTADRATATAWTTSPALYTYGGPMDVWGGFTPEEINNSGFGVVWRGYMGSTGIAIDYITITIYYTELGGDHHWTTGLSLASGAFVFRENATDHVSIAKTTGDTTFGGIVDADGYKQDGVLYDLSALGGGVTGPGTSTDRAIPTWNGTGGGALRDTTVAIDVNGNLTLASGDTVDGRDVSVDGAKLDGIAPGAEVNAVDSVNGQTGAVGLDADDIDDSATAHKFVTPSDITKLGNLSGTNTGDQSISLTGDLSGTWAFGGINSSIVANAVTNGKLAQVPEYTFKGRHVPGSGNVTDITVPEAMAMLGAGLADIPLVTMTSGTTVTFSTTDRNKINVLPLAHNATMQISGAKTGGHKFLLWVYQFGSGYNFTLDFNTTDFEFSPDLPDPTLPTGNGEGALYSFICLGGKYLMTAEIEFNPF